MNSKEIREPITIDEMELSETISHPFLFSSLLFYNLNFFPLHRSSYILLSYLPRTFSSLLLSTFEFIYFPPFHPTLSLPFFSSHSLSSLLFIPLSLPFFSSYSLSSLLFILLSLLPLFGKKTFIPYHTEFTKFVLINCATWQSLWFGVIDIEAAWVEL